MVSFRPFCGGCAGVSLLPKSGPARHGVGAHRAGHQLRSRERTAHLQNRMQPTLHLLCRLAVGRLRRDLILHQIQRAPRQRVEICSLLAHAGLTIGSGRNPVKRGLAGRGRRLRKPFHPVTENPL
ncbi:MAG: hypothetical protein ACTS10_07015 [Kiloniellales bacterium]